MSTVDSTRIGFRDALLKLASEREDGLCSTDFKVAKGEPFWSSSPTGWWSWAFPNRTGWVFAAVLLPADSFLIYVPMQDS